ncbi:hypothetical protein Ddc_11752 [Ditylenchus destructor]|nr:hypothetical protein Ddc_11752 [Ditylenchus destructor]
MRSRKVKWCAVIFAIVAFVDFATSTENIAMFQKGSMELNFEKPYAMEQSNNRRKRDISYLLAEAGTMAIQIVKQLIGRKLYETCFQKGTTCNFIKVYWQEFVGKKMSREDKVELLQEKFQISKKENRKKFDLASRAVAQRMAQFIKDNVDYVSNVKDPEKIKKFTIIGQLMFGPFVTKDTGHLKDLINGISKTARQAVELIVSDNGIKVKQQTKTVEPPGTKHLTNDEIVTLHVASEVISTAREHYELIDDECTDYIIAHRAIPGFENKISPPKHCTWFEAYKWLAILHVDIINEMPDYYKIVVMADYVEQHRRMYEYITLENGKQKAPDTVSLSMISMLDPYTYMLYPKKSVIDREEDVKKVMNDNGPTFCTTENDICKQLRNILEADKTNKKEKKEDMKNPAPQLQEPATQMHHDMNDPNDTLFGDLFD